MTPHAGIELGADQPVTLAAGPDETELLLLEGRPIAEPVAHHGPFVMNAPHELEQAFADYRRTDSAAGPGRATARSTLTSRAASPSTPTAREEAEPVGGQVLNCSIAR
jgi:hypothetical protein